MNNRELKPGLTFTWNGREIKIERFLAEGMTARVYLVSLDGHPVVLKALKEDSSFAVVNAFRAEIENMTLVFNAWEKLYPNEPNIVPKRHLSNTEPGNEFIVMEVIEGQEIDRALSGGGRLAEREALVFAEQMGRMLVLLHERMDRCYSDIKIGNFWRLTNDPEHIKVTDWGVLNKCTPELIQRDLFFATLILYNVVVGASLPYGSLRVTGRLDTPDHFKKLSPGLQNFFREALSVNFSRRFQTATEWLTAINSLLEVWRMDAAGLLNQAMQDGSALDGATEGRITNEIVRQYDRLDTVLYIAQNVPGIDFAAFERINLRYRQIKARFNRMEIGINQLRGWSYDNAVTTFQEVAELYPEQADVAYRWQWFARGAKELDQQFRSVSNAGFTAMEALVGGNPSRADDEFKRLMTSLEYFPDGWVYLSQEAALLTQVASALDKQRAGQMDEAIAILRTVVEQSRNLPTDPPIAWVSQYGNPADLLDVALNEKNTVGKARIILETAQRYVSEGRWDEAATALRNAYESAPDLGDTLDLWRRALELCAKSGSLDNILALTRAAVGTPAATEDLRAVHVAADRVKTLRECLQNGQIEDFSTHYESAMTAQAVSPLDLRAFVRQLVIAAVGKMSDPERFDLAMDLAAQVQVLDPAQTVELKTTIAPMLSGRIRRYQTLVDDGLLIVEKHLRSARPTDLDAARQTIGDLMTLTHHPDQDKDDAKSFLERYPPGEQPAIEKIWRLISQAQSRLEILVAEQDRALNTLQENRRQRIQTLKLQLGELEDLYCVRYFSLTGWERMAEILICMQELVSLEPDAVLEQKRRQIEKIFEEGGRLEMTYMLHMVATHLNADHPHEALRLLDRTAAIPWDCFPELAKRRNEYIEQVHAAIQVNHKTEQVISSIPQSASANIPTSPQKGK